MRVGAVTCDKSIGKISDLPIINSKYEYNNHNNFLTILLRINHVSYIKETKHTLLCPNQYHEYGTIINEIPINLTIQELVHPQS